jgi:hypothetical protein
MKTIGYFLLFFLTVISCKPKDVKADGMLALKEKETVTVKLDNQDVKIQLLEIKEERCIGKMITCFWEGSLAIKLAISNADKTSIVLGWWGKNKPTGHLPIPPPDAQILINNVPYEVSFEQVDIKNPNEDYIPATPKENYTIWVKLTKK